VSIWPLQPLSDPHDQREASGAFSLVVTTAKRVRRVPSNYPSRAQLAATKGAILQLVVRGSAVMLAAVLVLTGCAVMRAPRVWCAGLEPTRCNIAVVTAEAEFGMAAEIARIGLVGYRGGCPPLPIYCPLPAQTGAPLPLNALAAIEFSGGGLRLVTITRLGDLDASVVGWDDDYAQYVMSVAQGRQ
jgi:hypothetical protein